MSIYLIESNAVDNDDWITDHAGDPDEVDMTNYTEGTEYCEIEYIGNYNIIPRTGIHVTDLGSGSSISIKYGKRAYTIMCAGTVGTLADANYFGTMLMLARHTESTSWKQYYLIIKFATSTYVTFVDGSGNEKKYCKGVVTPSGSIRWSARDPLKWDVNFQFRSTW